MIKNKILKFINNLNSSNDLNHAILIFNKYNIKQKEEIISFFVELKSDFYDTNKDLIFDNKNIIENVLFQDPLFDIIAKKYLEENRFSSKANIFYSKLITNQYDDYNYAFNAIKFTNNFDILLHNKNLTFNFYQKRELFNIVTTKNIIDIKLKKIIIEKIGFYPKLIDFEINTNSKQEEIDFFIDNILKIKDLKIMINKIIYTFFDHIHQYNINNKFNENSFIHFVLNHIYLYNMIQTKLIQKLNKTHYQLFDYLFEKIDEILKNKKNLDNF